MADRNTVAISVRADAEQALAAFKSLGTVANVTFEQVGQRGVQAAAQLTGASSGVASALDNATGGVTRFGLALDQIDKLGGPAIGNLRQFQAAADSLKGSAYGASTAMGQFGFQIQDFVVQVQGGTSPITAFIQQGAQVAGAFGPIPALLSGIAAAVIGTTAAFFGLNSEIEETPDLVGTLIGSLQQAAEAAKKAADEVKGLGDAERGVVAAQAERQAKTIREEEIAPKGDEVVDALDTVLRDVEYDRLARLPPGRGPVPLFETNMRVSARVDDAKAKLLAAANAGKTDDLSAVGNEFGISGTVEFGELLAITARNASVLAQKEAAKPSAPAESAIPRTLDFGDSNAYGPPRPPGIVGQEPQLGLLPDTSDIQAQIEAENKRLQAIAQENERLKREADQKRAQDEARAEQAARQAASTAQSLIASAAGASKDESPAEGIARINRELDEFIAKVESLRDANPDPGGGGKTDAELDEAIALQRRNASREIAGIQEREAAEKTAETERARREAESARRKNEQVEAEEQRKQATITGAQEELAAAEKIAAARRSDLDATRAMHPERIRVAQVEAAQAEIVALKRREAATAAAAAAVASVAVLERELAAAQQIAQRKRASANAPGATDADRTAATAADSDVAARTETVERARASSATLVATFEREADATDKTAAAKREAANANQRLADSGGKLNASAREHELRLQAEARIRERSRGLSTAQAAEIRRVEEAKLRETIETEKLTEAIKNQNEENEKAAKLEEFRMGLRVEALGPGEGPNARQQAMLDAQLKSRELGATPQQQVEDARMAGLGFDNKEIQAAEQRYQEQMADVLLEPWRQLASQTSGIVAGIFEEFLSTGRVSLESLTADVAGGLNQIFSGAAANLITQPLNEGINALRSTMDAAISSGQGIGAGFSQFVQQNPGTAAFMSGALGVTAGNAITAATGGNQMGSTIGGTVGAVGGGIIGSYFGPYGTAAGAAVGGAAGGFLGGLFGGDDLANDRARLDFYARDGITYQDESSSPENRGVVNAFASEVDSLVEALAGLGGEVANVQLQFAAGNESGLEFQGQEYTDNASLMNAVIRYIGQNTQGLSANQQTVLRNTDAGSVQEVAGDLAFADALDRARRNMGPLAIQLDDLKDSFTAMRTRAEQLGLATDGLSASYQRQRREIIDQARDQIGAFTGNRTQAGVQIDAIRDQARDLTEMGRDIGISTAGVAAAMRRQIAEIRDGIRDEVRSFAGDRTSFGEALTQLRQRFEDLEEAARDVGVATAGLNAAYWDQVAEIRAQGAAQVDAIRYDEQPVWASLDALEKQFEEAKRIAGDLKLPTTGLQAGYQRERRQIIEGVEQEMRAFTGGAPVAAFDQLVDRFEALRQAAWDAGKATGGLEAAFVKQAAAMEKAANDNVRNAERTLIDQTRGLQDLFGGLIEPITQALGPFGIGQGITAPEAQVEGGIELFREQLKLARAGDLDALQGIVGIGQQTVGAAREYGASGEAFTSVFLEVNKGLAEVQSRLQDRQLEALRGIEDVGRETLDEMVRLRREGIENVRYELEQLRFEVRQLEGRRSA